MTLKVEKENTNETSDKSFMKGKLLTIINTLNIEEDEFKISKEDYEDVLIYHFDAYKEYDAFTIVVARKCKESILKADNKAKTLISENNNGYILGAILSTDKEQNESFENEIKQFCQTCNNVCILDELELPYLLSIFYSEGANAVHFDKEEWINEYTFHAPLYLKVISCNNKDDVIKFLDNCIKTDYLRNTKVTLSLIREDTTIDELSIFESLINKLYEKFPNDFSIKYGLSISKNYADIVLLKK